jgi:ECF transporter S component (folate family)
MSNTRKKVAVFGTVRALAMCAVLVAMSIILGKYLAIRGGEILRFSFENLPLLMAGILFGPLAGLVTGVAADLVGCVMVGYAINPIVTAGAALIGLLGGLLWRMLSKLPYGLRLSLTVAVSHVVGSVLVKTVGLAAFYSMPIGVLALWRLLNYAIVGGLEFLLLYFVLKNKAIRSFGRER